MNIIGNILLVIATIIFVALCGMTLFSKEPVSGAGWSYRWPVFPGIMAFLICLAIVTFIILKQGGFDWLGLPSGKMAIYIVLAILMIFLGSRYMSANLEIPYVRLLSGSLHVLIPILLLISAGVLLNFNYANVSPHLYKTTLYAGLIAIAGSIVIIFLGKIILFVAYYLGGGLTQNSDTQRKLEEIEAADKMATLDLIYYAHPYHPNNVRRRALSKIKSRTDWQEALVLALKGDKAPDVFSFLAFNEVKNKNLFSEALGQGILAEARLIQEEIRNAKDTDSMNEWNYHQEVENVLHTLDKFKGTGEDYCSALQELENALDEPTSFERQEFQAKSLINEWLKKH